MAMFNGFTTIDRSRKFKITDFDLCKRDLLNHFNIRKGTKLMNQNFGTIIWNLIFEPMTESVKTMIIEDVKTIVSYDPRISVESVNLVEYDHGIRIEIGMIYVNTNTPQQLFLEFSRNASVVKTL